MPLPVKGKLTTLRSAAPLTTSYVASNSLPCEEANKAYLYVDFTLGSLTSGEFKVEFSDDNTNWYFDDAFGEKSLSADAKKVYEVGIKGKYIRVQCKGSGTTTGSSMAVSCVLAIEV